MSQDYQDYDQQQDQGWMPQDPSQEYGKGSKQDPHQQKQQQGSRSQQSGQQAQGQGSLAAAKQMANQQIDQAIDQFASKIPGGQQLAQPAKEACSGILDKMEKAAISQMSGKPGGGQRS
jgi:hypothetical protein